MKQSPCIAPIASVLFALPLTAQVGEVIDGVTFEFPWSVSGDPFEEFASLHFRSETELDCAALCGDEVFLVYHPGRFELVYPLLSDVASIATIALGDGTDAVLALGPRGVELARWDTSGSSGFTSTATIAVGPWEQATELWAFPLGAGTTRICAYAPLQSQLLQGDFDGTTFNELTPLFLGEALRDLRPIEWSAVDEGPELAWLFENNLFVATSDGATVFDWYPATPADHIGVARGDTSEDVLLWVSSYVGSPWLYARSATTAYTPFALGPDPRTDLVVLDRDGDGVEDVCLPSGVNATATILRRGTTTFGPFADGDTLQLTDTSGGSLQLDPVAVGTAGDFDNDGTIDLFLGQTPGVASQYVGRPEYEERWRPSVQDEDGVVPARTPTSETLSLDFASAATREYSTYHVQAYAFDWTTATFDALPLDDLLLPYDTGQGETTVSVTYDLSRLPAEYAIFVMVAQVDAAGSAILARLPARIVYWSPFPHIELALSLLPYPSNTDPFDNGNGTGGRLGGRMGGPKFKGGDPPP